MPRTEPSIDASPAADPAPDVFVGLLGPVVVRRGGRPLALPASRKVRGLLAYLAMASTPASRSALCEMFWEVPNDPRGELRWCLSKLRGVLDGDGASLVLAIDDRLQLDVERCRVDALEVLRATENTLANRTLEALQTLTGLFRGDFLEGLEIGRAPAFGAWLTAQRRRFRSCHAAILERIAARVPAGEQALPALERWLALAPFDLRVHEALLRALARCGRRRDAEEHLAATLRQFEADGLDAGPLHHAWRRIRDTGLHPASEREPEPIAPAATPGRPSIAVMPFADLPATGRGGVADALAYDVITRLAKMRTLFVIAQGTVFALHERGLGAEEAGRMLNVAYVVGGTVRTRADRLAVSVELVETRAARIVWSEVFNVPASDALVVLDAIGDRVVASIAAEIETHERNRAVLKAPDSLDAWEAYHRGLWHMYRYRQEDNDRAKHFFEVALRQDPTFSRAHAGLSFTHFQDAFQDWAPRAVAIEAAYRSASQGLMADERDPAVHWALGRALWLDARHGECLAPLRQSIELSPNFALGHYNLSFVNAIVGDARAAVESADYSRQLSPFDPMLFGMYGARAMALARLGRFEEAAAAAVKAAARPNAFPHIHALAACCQALAGHPDLGHTHVAAARGAVPRYTFSHFPLLPVRRGRSRPVSSRRRATG
ncbi:MAG: BTAD domain-containing putative transcriptional regulator [Burkholderiales bacterium]